MIPSTVGVYSQFFPFLSSDIVMQKTSLKSLYYMRENALKEVDQEKDLGLL